MKKSKVVVVRAKAKIKNFLSSKSLEKTKANATLMLDLLDHKPAGYIPRTPKPSLKLPKTTSDTKNQHKKKNQLGTAPITIQKKPKTYTEHRKPGGIGEHPTPSRNNHKHLRTQKTP